MSNTALAFSLASTLLAIAGAVSLTPVKAIRAWFRKSSERTGRDVLLGDDEAPGETRQEVVSTLMKAYLHDRAARDHLQLAAATHNLHPICPEDLLAQLIFIRRDLGRVMRDSANQRSSLGVSAFAQRIDYLQLLNEPLRLRDELPKMKTFQQNVRIPVSGVSGAVTNFQRRSPLKRRMGTIQ